MSALDEFLTRLEEVVRDHTAQITKLVTHRNPDDDAWACLWMAKRFFPETKHAQIVFVNAGSRLPEAEDDGTILYFDTGGGDFDQHGRRLKRASSAQLMAAKLGLDRDPALAPIIEHTVSVDNIDPQPQVGLHSFILGYPRMLKGEDGQTDWGLVQQRVFELFELIYGQAKARLQSENKDLFSKSADWRLLPNSLKVCVLIGKPFLRDQAFENGADVVVWTKYRGRKGYNAGIQVSRRHQHNESVVLGPVVANLREAEARKRGIDTGNEHLDYLGRRDPVNNWLYHDSRKLVLHGSGSWELKNEEYTRLPIAEMIMAIMKGIAILRVR